MTPLDQARATVAARMLARHDATDADRTAAAKIRAGEDDGYAVRHEVLRIEREDGHE